MSAILATAEGAFEILANLEEEIDVLMKTLDENLDSREVDHAAECGQKIFELLRMRLHLKTFIDNNINDGSVPTYIPA